MKINEQFTHFNFKEIKEGVYFVSNDFYKWLMLAQNEFNKLLVGDVSKEDDPEFYDILYKNYFIIDENNFKEAADYMFSAKPVHQRYDCTMVLKITNFCNYNCIYCQASSDVSNGKCVMTKETAKNAVDFIFKSKCHYICFEFQGGEPLSNFEIMKFVVEYANENKGDRIVHFRTMTNLSLLTDEMLDYIKKRGISIGTSLDGPEDINNKSRMLKDGTGTYSFTQTKRDHIKEITGDRTGFLSTVPRSTLPYAKEFFEFHAKEQEPFIIRPLFNLGKAEHIWDEIGYSADEFLMFYEQVLQYTLDYNKEHPGTRVIERRTTYFVGRILYNLQRDIELTSPCGSIINMLSIDYNGDIIACEGAKMVNGDKRNHFVLGNINTDDFLNVFFGRHTHDLLKANISENDLHCSRCAYQHYCGQCAVERYTSKDTYLFNCKLNQGMIGIILKKLYENKDGEGNILRHWADILKCQRI